jgi:hypothetical protein
MSRKGRPMELLATARDKNLKKETIKTKVKILTDISQEDHVNYVWQRLPLPTPLPRKKLQLPHPQPPMDLNPQLFILLNSAHNLLNSTKPPLVRIVGFVSLQAFHRYMDSLEASPGNKLNPPLTKPNITNVKLTHPAPQCLQSLQG